MTKNTPKAASSRKSSKTGGDYAVGKGKPPKEHQFKPKQSGNPNGRRSAKAVDPKLSKLVERHKVEFLEELYQLIEITQQDGKKVKITKFQALIRGMFKEGFAGNRHLMIKLLDYLSLIERENRDTNLETLQHAFDYKRRMRAVLDKAERENKPPPKMDPHPDDVIIDETLGDVGFRDPTIRRIYDQLGTLSDKQDALAAELTNDEVQDEPVRKQLDSLQHRMHILQDQLEEKLERENAARGR